jgi:signal transduction histidine kinase
MSTESVLAYPVRYDWQDWPSDRVLPEFDAETAEAERCGNQSALAQALIGLGAARGALGHQGAEDTLERAEVEATRAGDLTLLFQCLLARARHDVDRGRHAGALATCRRLEGLARAQSDFAMVRQVLFVAGTSLCHLGEHDLALESFEEARMLLRAHPTTLAEQDHRVANGRYAAARAQAWLMRGGLLLEANGPDTAAYALQQARKLGEQALEMLLGTAPRFSHAALFGLVRVLLEMNLENEARAWIDRLETQDPIPAAMGTLALAQKRLSQAMIELRAPNGESRQVLSWLAEVASCHHPRVTNGDLRLSLLRCEFEAYEADGEYRMALERQREWARTKSLLRTNLAKEHGAWMADALATLRAEAHEFVSRALRSPLLEAKASLSQLQGGESRVHQCVSRAIDIADQYLGVVRAEHLRSEDMVVLNLSELVDEVCDEMAPPTNSPVRLERRIDRPVFVRGDSVLLMRALGNLISNALKHAPESSVVRITLESGAGNTATLSVKDCGPGMSLEMRARVFQRFATGAVRKGNGLGLAMVARVARVHGARIVVESKPGEGTCVAIQLGLDLTRTG